MKKTNHLIFRIHNFTFSSVRKEGNIFFVKRSNEYYAHFSVFVRLIQTESFWRNCLPPAIIISIEMVEEIKYSFLSTAINIFN